MEMTFIGTSVIFKLPKILLGFLTFLNISSSCDIINIIIAINIWLREVVTKKAESLYPVLFCALMSVVHWLHISMVNLDKHKRHTDPKRLNDELRTKNVKQ